MKSRNPLRVELLRDALVESQHDVVAIVLDERGSLKSMWGNGEYMIFPRSTIKPLQAIPFVESGAVEGLGLDDRMIALACASHRGETFHFEVLKEWSTKVDLPENCLICGGHLPFDEEAQKEFIQKKTPLTPYCHNCAGKHLGILSTCKHLGHPLKGYEQTDHPCQVAIKKTLSAVTQFDHEKAIRGVDGCGIPTYALPLKNIALGLNVFVSSKVSGKRKETCERILQAWKAHPQLISGSKSFTSRAMEVSQGKVLLKNGAEGTLCGVLPELKMTFAVKASDGAARAAEAATLFLLHKLEAITKAESEALRPLALPLLKNSRDETIGQVRVVES